MCLQVVPALVEETILFLLDVLGSLVKYYLNLNSGLSSVPLFYVSVFMPLPYCLNCCSFVV